MWENNRSDNDIYAQCINREGTVQWTVNGVAICAVAALQSNAQIVSDGSGGAVIIWQDWRNGNNDIYAQRVNGKCETVLPIISTLGSPMTIHDTAHF